MTNYEKIVLLQNEFKGRPWNEIPKERLEKIDWLGYGWPTIDCNGDFICVCLGAALLDSPGARTTIVLDPDGLDWLLLDYPDDENDPPPLPDGFTISPDND